MKRTITALALALTSTTAAATDFSECMVAEVSQHAGAPATPSERMVVSANSEVLEISILQIMSDKGMDAMEAINMVKMHLAKEGMLDEDMAKTVIMSMNCSGKIGFAS